MTATDSQQNAKHELSQDLEIALIQSDRISADMIMHKAWSFCTVPEVMTSIITPALHRIGKRWESGELALAQVYMGGRIAEDILEEKISSMPVNPLKNEPKIAVAVIEDYHSLGKKMVLSSLRSAGYAPLDYGVHVSATDLASRIVEDKIEILFLSALMIRAALAITDLTKIIQEKKIRTHVIVGGAPFLFDPDLANEVGATRMVPDAPGTVDIVRLYEEGAL